jgi:hypothetical protein
MWNGRRFLLYAFLRNGPARVNLCIVVVFGLQRQQEKF